MSPERWRQIQELFDRAQSKHPGERAAFLENACAGNDELRREVEWMLAHQDDAERFIQRPAFDVAASALAAGRRAILVGSSLGHYQNLQLIGAGGMGEVYKARDPKLGRDVAIKVLPPAFANDPLRLARFQREAQVLALLNHPNISVIHDIQEDQGTRFLILELIEGETLAERLKCGPLAIDEALGLARQIAEALEAAHGKGIFHRDLKPANIQVTHDGRVKVLDFGLAKLTEPEGKFDAAETSGNVILGTAAYMSPEQASGGAVDKRTDVWSFGCVLYEALTGHRAFPGENAADILVSVMKAEPDCLLLPPAMPPSVLSLLRRCLQRHPKSRLHDMADIRIAVEDALKELQSAPLPAQLPIKSRQRRWKIPGYAALLFIGVVVGWTMTRTPPEARLLTHFQISVEPASQRAGIGTLERAGPTMGLAADPGFAVSPDGASVVFVASDSRGDRVLWIRPLSSAAARELPGTEFANRPFWSPDGRFIGFFSQGKLKKIEVDGRLPQTITEVIGTGMGGGTWNPDGVILFGTSRNNVLYRVSANGGTPIPATRFDASRRENWHLEPQFLPDGQHFIYLAAVTSQTFSGVYVGSIETGDTKRLLDNSSNAIYADPGYLLFLRDGFLMAQPFDATRLEIHGQPLQIAEQVNSDAFGLAHLSVSNSGVIAYKSDNLDRQLVWMDRSGKQLGLLGSPGRYSRPALSPDGKQVALGQTDPQTRKDDVWLFDIGRNVPSRFTFDPLREHSPVWSPDGKEILFASTRQDAGFVKKLASGSGDEEVVLKSDLVNKVPNDWSGDGRFVVYEAIDSRTGSDLWVLPLDGSRQPFSYLQSDYNETGAQFSPDGSWVVYTSNESGKREVYIQSFPKPGNKRRISTAGGVQPRWRGDGREIFYIDLAGALISVELTADLEPLLPKTLFDAGVDSRQFHEYAVTFDGQKFLLNKALHSDAQPINVIVNWTVRAPQYNGYLGAAAISNR